MNLKNKMTLTLTKIQRQTLKLPVARLRCPACDAEFEVRAALSTAATTGETGRLKIPSKTK